MATRSTILDDMDPRIKYEGDWKLADGNGWGYYQDGDAMFSTLHMLNVSTGSFSFEFEGSSGRVVGSNTVRTTPDIDPQWTCSIDGTPLHITYSTVSRNNWPFCEWDADEGHHTVTFNVTRISETRQLSPFLFDYVLYNSSTTNSQPLQMVYANDTEIKYGSDWAPFANGTMSTGVSGSTLNFPFTGTGIQLLGSIPVDASRNLDATATYSVDNGRPITFEIIPRDDIIFNSRLVDVPSIPPGTHNIAVTYRGNQSMVPLVVSAFIVHNEAASTSSTVPNNGAPTTSSPASATIPSKSLPIAGIIGLVVGVLALLISSFVLWRYVWHRRRRDNSDSSGSHPHVQPFAGSRTNSMDTLPSTKSEGPRRSHAVETPSSILPPTKQRPLSGYHMGSSVQPSVVSDGDVGVVTQEIRHEDSGLRIVDGVVTMPNPPTYNDPALAKVR